MHSTPEARPTTSGRWCTVHGTLGKNTTDQVPGTAGNLHLHKYFIRAQRHSQSSLFSLEHGVKKSHGSREYHVPVTYCVHRTWYACVRRVKGLGQKKKTKADLEVKQLLSSRYEHFRKSRDSRSCGETPLKDPNYQCVLTLNLPRHRGHSVFCRPSSFDFLPLPS